MVRICLATGWSCALLRLVAVPEAVLSGVMTASVLLCGNLRDLGHIVDRFKLIAFVLSVSIA